EYIGRSSISLSSLGRTAPGPAITLTLHNDSPHGRALELYHLLQLRRRVDHDASEFLKATKGDFQTGSHK
ncbi:hypothetical protein ACI3PL_30950, partial [Lacticaseibacillus paracasei]